MVTGADLPTGVRADFVVHEIDNAMLALEETGTHEVEGPPCMATKAFGLRCLTTQTVERSTILLGGPSRARFPRESACLSLGSWQAVIDQALRCLRSPYPLVDDACYLEDAVAAGDPSFDPVADPDL